MARRKLEEEKEKEHIAVEEDPGTTTRRLSAFGSILESFYRSARTYEGLVIGLGFP